jgi:hypothetical protein
MTMASEAWIPDDSDWTDAEGRLLLIRSRPGGSLVASYVGPDGRTPFVRVLLDGTAAPSLDMPARYGDNRLVVELGTPGLGPTLCLTYSSGDRGPLLVPEVGRGLYDDWESDCGVPWVFPLLGFRPRWP